MPKLFISHAFEDKAELVRPLVTELERHYEVWYDEYELQVGDSLFLKISEGLNECDFGIVVLSRAFISITKKWPAAELAGLFVRETAKKKVILPVWHNITEENVRAFSPILADRFAASSSSGVESLARKIQSAVDDATRVASPSPRSETLAKLKTLGSKRASEKHNKEILSSLEGASLVRKSASDCLEEVQESVKRFSAEEPLIEFKVNEIGQGQYSTYLNVNAPRGLFLRLEYSIPYSNSAADANLKIGMYRLRKNDWGEPMGNTHLSSLVLYPQIPEGREVLWEGTAGLFTKSEVIDHALRTLIDTIETDEAKKASRISAAVAIQGRRPNRTAGL